MAWLLCALLVVTAGALRQGLGRDPIWIDGRELALVSILALALFVLSALPLVWLGRWSAASHALVAAGLAIFAVLGARPWARRRDWNLRPGPASAGAVAAIAIGIALQGSGVYHAYLTHDSGVYLGAATHLHRTGRFFHEHAIERRVPPQAWEALATGDKPWMSLHAFGLFARSEPGLSSFHGLFGAPLLLALGIDLFGEGRMLWIHGLLLAIAVWTFRWVLAAALGNRERWIAAGTLLFALVPQMSALYREPISEPLAQVFFLGMLVVCVSGLGRAGLGDRALFVCLAMAALCVRASALFYLPFLFLALLMSDAHHVSTRAHRAFWSGVALALFFVVATVSFASPTYLSRIPEAILSKVLGPVSLPYDRIMAPLLVGLLAATLALRGPIRSIGGKLALFWRLACGIGGGLLLAGLVYRYVKTALVFGVPEEGFWLSRYNVEALFFWITPIVAGAGLVHWGRYLLSEPLGDRTFLQGLVPFLLAFYLVYYFGPFPTQPYMTRYFLTELAPLLVLGAVVSLAGKDDGGRRIASGRIVLATAIAWCAVVSVTLRHPRACANTMAELDGLRDALGRSAPERTVLLSATPSWLSNAAVMALVPRYGFNAGFINRTPSPSQWRAVEEARRAGFRPLAVVDSAAVGTANVVARFAHCYAYPRYGLAAPPLDLGRYCLDLSFVELGEPPPATLSRAAPADKIGYH